MGGDSQLTDLCGWGGVMHFEDFGVGGHDPKSNIPDFSFPEVDIGL